MSIRSFASRSPLRVLLAAALFGVLSSAAGVQAARAARPPATASKPGSAAATASKAPAASAASAPDVKWLKDEEGREYRLEKMEKGLAVRLDPKTVRSKWGIPIQVVKEDAKYYYYKVYKEPAAADAVPSVVPKEPTAEDKQKLSLIHIDAADE